MALLVLDIENAFNEADRTKMLEHVPQLESLKALRGILRFRYGEPSLMLTRDSNNQYTTVSTYISSQGVRQGDPLGSLIFAVFLHLLLLDVCDLNLPELENLKAEHVKTETVACADDVNVVDDPISLMKIFNAFKLAAKERLGLTVSGRKSFI